MNKIVKSFAVIAFVGAIAIGATSSYFSDTETSAGNTFTAGAIDLKIDDVQHYNGNVCVKNAVGADPLYIWQGQSAYPVPGTACEGTWEASDLGAQRFFSFADIKPGDSGEDTISLHVDNNDAWLCGAVSNLINNDNGITEPESAVDTTDGTGNGELQNYLVMNIWRDTGADINDDGQLEGICDNVHQDGELVLATGNPVNGILPIYDSTTNTGALPAGSTVCLGVAWELPAETGNIVQTDSVTGDISFDVVQSRNNPNFSCAQL